MTAALLAFNPGSVLEQGSENLLFNYQFAITVSSGSFPLDSVAYPLKACLKHAAPTKSPAPAGLLRLSWSKSDGT